MSENISFEDRLNRAKEILEKLLDPSLPMDESVKAYESGIKEIQAAQKLLEDAKLQIETIKNQG